jgi:acetylornithine deacetylase
VPTDDIRDPRPPSDAPDSDDVVALAAALMAAESTSGGEAPAVDVAVRWLTARGWRVRRVPVGPGRDCLVAEGGRPAEVVLSTHLDTVPPFIAPRLADGRLVGRGACDAKGIAAAMAVAAGRLRDDGTPVGLLFVVGEETAHDGAHAADAAQPTLAPRVRALVNGEPTESRLALGTKGALRFVLRAEGRAAHSAYPHLGDSATRRLVRLLADLETLALPDDPVLGATTLNVGALAGGVADNVIAPWAEARCMVRLVTPAAEVQALLEAWLARHPEAAGPEGARASISYGPVVPPVRLGTVPGFETAVMAYATDIPALGRWGTPYLFGPGSIHVAHTDHEFVDVGELRAAVDGYVRIARAALAGADAASAPGGVGGR